MERDKTSKEILPIENRRSEEWINWVHSEEPCFDIVLYHKALESSESEVERLMEENRKLELKVRDYDIDLFETSEERDKLKEEKENLQKRVTVLNSIIDFNYKESNDKILKVEEENKRLKELIKSVGLFNEE